MDETAGHRAARRAAAGPGAVRVRIEGRVQGVGYRAWAIGEARRRGLRGWVRNRRDGSVEAVFAGAPAAVAAMVAACRIGPAGAAVSSVEETPDRDDGADGFAQRPTE